MYIATMSNLTHLFLENTRVTGTGFESHRFERLRFLLLKNSQITDAGLAAIGGIKNLEFLDLESTQVTDVGLEHLSSLTKLSYLSLAGTRVTAAALVDLRRARPNCMIPYRMQSKD